MNLKKFDFINQKGDAIGSMNIIHDNQLHIFGDIDFRAGVDCVCPLDVTHFLASVEHLDDIEIHINSCGGCVYTGIAMYNILKSWKGHKKIYINGICASIATIIAMGGDEIYINNNSYFMIHLPLAGLNGFYNTVDLLTTQKLLMKTTELMIDIYSTKLARADTTREHLLNLLKNETWFIGSEVCDLFDISLIDEDTITLVANSNLSMYKNVPIKLQTKADLLTEINEICYF